MKGIRIFIILSVLLPLASCDMSRWYFRHGGKSSSGKSFVERPQRTPFKQPESAYPITNDTVLSDQEDLVMSHSENASNDAVAMAPESASTQLEAVAEHQNHFPKNSFQKEKSEQNQSASAQRMHTNPGPLILMLVVVFILALAMIGALIFLFSWIFVPAAIALRIALWGVLIVFGLYLLLFLGLLLFSD